MLEKHHTLATNSRGFGLLWSPRQHTACIP